MPPNDDLPADTEPRRPPMAVPVEPNTSEQFEYVEDWEDWEDEQPEEAAPRNSRRKRRAPRSAPMVRVMLAFMAAACGAILVCALWLRPYDDDGQPLKMATHTQLGMPPCNMVVMTGKPCPACGMTTSFSLLAHGDVLASLQANWVGTLLAAFTFLLIPWGFISAIRGRMLWLKNAELSLTITLAVLLGLMVIRWAYIFFFT